MGWKSLVTGGIILALVLGATAEYTTFLFVTHQSCAAASTTSSKGYGLFGITSTSTFTASSSNATIGGAAPLSPAPIASADLVLAPLATLSIGQGNYTAITDLTNVTYWQEVHASEYQTYEQILPGTVMGLMNSSQEWKSWALKYIPDSPSWLAIGFVTQANGQLLAVDPTSGGGRSENSTAIEKEIKDFAGSASGVTLASLDYVSFNSLTALKVLLETGDAKLAACQTMAGQLTQLFLSSFDKNVPQAERAQYLGQALAITSVMILLGGKDGFAAKFETAIRGLGLGDSWPAVKPYLGDIASKASAGASSATFAVLQTLAQRFPQDSAWVTGLTADRIDSMVNVLGKKGVSDKVTQDDIEHVAEVAQSSPDEQAAGEAADASSLQDGGSVLLKIKAQNKIVRYIDATGRTANIRGVFLQPIIPGFNPRGPNFVVIHYEEAGVTMYHYYDQKVAPDQPFEPKDTEWNPRAPEIVGKPGDVVSVTFELLTPDKFLKSVPPIDYMNISHAPWVSGFSEVKSFQLIGDKVRMSLLQEPFDGISSLTVDGAFHSMENSNGATSVLFSIPNVMDKPRMMKISFDGYSEPTLSISSGSNYNEATSISSDGIRLRIVSNSGGPAVTTSTLYLREPSIGWDLGAMNEQDLGFPVQHASKTFRVDQVNAVDAIDNALAHSKYKIDLGRAGAEIACTVVEEKFQLNDVRLYEITQGGKDLDTRDGTTVIQARMLADPNDLTGHQLAITLETQMNDLTEKIQEDFQNNSGATTGYAILSYLDPSSNVIHTLIAEVHPGT